MTYTYNQRGITLIELMIVIVVLAIVVGIAVPSYRNYVLRAHRADATAALLKVRAAQERFFLQNNRYATDAELVANPNPGPGLGFNRNSEHGYFQLATGPDPTPGAPPASFQVTATALGGQVQDSCRSFSITDRGVRGATNAGGATSQTIIDNCWR
jgi:type IV pilus assembly protein PilE